jgi:hypothetical protein
MQASTQLSQEAAQREGSINTTSTQSECVVGHSSAIQDSQRVAMVANILASQREQYLANGATLAGKVLEREALRAKNGTLPSDPEQLRALGEALTPFHRIGRDVFGLGGDGKSTVNVQVNIADMSDARFDVVEV